MAAGLCIVATAGVCLAAAAGAALTSAAYRVNDFAGSDMTKADVAKLGVGLATDVGLVFIPGARVASGGTKFLAQNSIRIPLGRVGEALTGAKSISLGNGRLGTSVGRIPLGRVGRALTGATGINYGLGRLEAGTRWVPLRAAATVGGWITTNHDPFTNAVGNMMD